MLSGQKPYNSTLISKIQIPGEENMSIKPFVVQPEDRAEALNAVAGDKITVLASKEETQGYEVFWHESQAGFEIRPHSHDWDETFIVIEGDLKFSINGEEITAKVGTLVHLPAGTVHEFKFGENGAKLISITGERSKASSLFSDLAAENSNSSPSQEKLMAIIDKHGIHTQ
jgi:quercetin dioxygenase-like cupin family protein